MAQGGSGRGSSEQTQETLKKILSVTGQVLWFISKWCLIAAFWMFVFAFSFTIGIFLTAMGIKMPEFATTASP